MKKILVFLPIFILILFEVNGQDTINIENNLRVQESLIIQDTIVPLMEGELTIDNVALNLPPEFKPNPTRAVIYSAIFPGLGQIYNRKYWKLPLIYGGFIGLTYAISWNGRYYNDYTLAYRGIMADDPRSDENFAKWSNFLQGNVDPGDIGDSRIIDLRRKFKRKKDYFRRNRDLSIIGMVALYGICMIDAYVDAHLFDFNISPDLSLKVEPTVIGPFSGTYRSFGVQCSFKF